MLRAFLSFVALFTFAAIAMTRPAPALRVHSTGISGYSGNPASGGATCITCHSGGLPPTTKISGPDLVATGNQVSYTLTISGGQRIAGGLDVSVTGGQLVVTDSGTKLLNGEVTHNAPRAADSKGDVTFGFDWIAPTTAGTYYMFGAGNSVNDDNTNGGDYSDKTRLILTVEDGSVSFTPYGTGLAGAGGFVPAISGTNGSASGNYSMHFTQGLGGAPGLVVLGIGRDRTPLFGGTVWIDLALPFWLVPIALGGTTGAAGQGFLDLNGVDVRDFLGTTVYLQGAFVDAGAIRGVSLSNALRMEIQ